MARCLNFIEKRDNLLKVVQLVISGISQVSRYSMYDYLKYYSLDELLLNKGDKVSNK